MSDRPVPAAREIPEEMTKAASRQIRYSSLREGDDVDEPFRQSIAVEALRAGLDAAPASFLARLLVGALGGEEAVVHRLAALEFQGPHGNVNGDLYDQHEDTVDDYTEHARFILRSLMEDTPDD